jgi:hypothetical protein
MRRFRDLRATPLAILLGSVVLAVGASLLAVTARRIAAPRTAHERLPKKTKAPHAPSGNGRQAQRASSGVGPLMHRRYIVDIPRSRGSAKVGASTLMRAIKRQMTSLSPEALARFRKSRGEPGEMRIGDEYHITMLGPWNGRVRVVAVAPDSFTLITLKGHPESGHITFRVRERGAFGTSLRVSIESWARSRDSTVDLAYAKLGVGKHVQAEVWVTFLQRACELAGVEAAPRVRITSEEVNA